MRSLSVWTIVFLGLFSLSEASVYAGSPLPGSVCPAITEDAARVLSTIQSLRDQLNQQPECRSLDEKLTAIGKIIANPKWTKVKSLLAGNNSASLEDAEIKEAADLIESASSNVAEAVSALAGRNSHCLKGKKRGSFLSRFSGIVREVSTVAANVTGPYGMAISIGGGFLASAVSGIDQIFAGRAYDFSKPEQELLFMNQFCSFSEIQKDIGDYLGLATRNEELTLLSSYMTQKISDLRTNCDECSAFEIAWNAREETDKIVHRIRIDASIVGYGNDLTARDYTRCKEMHRAFHTSDSDFSRYIGALASYSNPMTSRSDEELIRGIVGVAASLKDVYPDLANCVRLSPEQKISVSRDFNNLMRDEILPLNQQIFDKQMQAFQSQANKKFVHPLGDYMERSLCRLDWIDAERGRVAAKLADPNYSVSAEKIRENKRWLEGRFVNDLLPEYLAFQTRRNLKTLDVFEKAFLKLRGDSRQTPASRTRVLDELSLALDQTRTLNRYCEHTRYLMLSTPATAKACAESKQRVLNRYGEIARIDTDVARLIGAANAWSEGTELTQTSRVSEYSNMIREWNERGSSRWCRKEEANCR